MKRGMTEKTVLSLVLAVAAIVLFLYVIFNATSKGGEGIMKTQCRESIREVIAAAASPIPGTALLETVACTKKELEYSTDDAALKLAIANELYDCWDKWDRGESKLFAPGKVYCNTCAVFLPDSKPRTLKGLIAFMRQRPLEQGLTYAEVLRGNLATVQQEPPKDEISTGERYAVVFRYAEKLTFKQYSTTNYGGILGIKGPVIGYEVGAQTEEKWASDILLVPESWVQPILGCTTFVGIA